MQRSIVYIIAFLSACAEVADPGSGQERPGESAVGDDQALSTVPVNEASRPAEGDPVLAGLEADLAELRTHAQRLRTRGDASRGAEVVEARIRDVEERIRKQEAAAAAR